MKGRILKLGKDIDTDQILPSQYMLLPSIDEMKQYAFEPIVEDFPQKSKSQNILVADDNFGCGSSREQAPSILKALGVQVIVAKSFARIFFRNAVNIGLPVVICADLADQVADGEEIEVDLNGGVIRVPGTGKVFTSTKLPARMTEILEAGGLLRYLNSREGD